ncbi:MAG TPA: helix-turn-helix domain-containing protein, partial [Solirubrobacterales bacterium]|nr:helix-turn-helix domain-containing protein [Solirubrobacterales bacterium]
VSSVSQLLEERLARVLSERDNRLRSLFIDRLGAEGKGRSALVTRCGRVVAAYPKNWLGRRVAVGTDGNLVFPAGIEVEVEPLNGHNGALLVRGTSARAQPQRAATTIEALPPRRVRVARGDWHVDLSPRHSEIITQLALHPDGLSNEEIRELLYEAGAKSVTVRAEISRLRKLLGPILLSNPYRLEQPVRADPAELRELLDSSR